MTAVGPDFSRASRARLRAAMRQLADNNKISYKCQKLTYTTRAPGYGLRTTGFGLRASAWWSEVTNTREIVEEMGGAACRVADQDRGRKLTPRCVLRSPRRVSAQTAPLRQSSGSGIRTGNAVLQRSPGGCVRAGAPGRARGGERVDWTVTFTATTSSGSAPCSQGRCETCAPFSFARAPAARERHGKARSLEPEPGARGGA